MSSASLFQSSPNLSAGCSAITCVSFNPHLTSRLGASKLTWFQSSPNLSGWVQLSDTSWCDVSWAVSILTQPLGRVHRYTGGRVAWAGAWSGFNPHPTYRLGAAFL